MFPPKFPKVFLFSVSTALPTITQDLGDGNNYSWVGRYVIMPFIHSYLCQCEQCIPPRSSSPLPTIRQIIRHDRPKAHFILLHFNLPRTFHFFPSQLSLNDTGRSGQHYVVPLKRCYGSWYVALFKVSEVAASCKWCKSRWRMLYLSRSTCLLAMFTSMLILSGEASMAGFWARLGALLRVSCSFLIYLHNLIICSVVGPLLGGVGVTYFSFIWTNMYLC